MPAPLPSLIEIPPAYWWPVLRAAIAIEEMRAAHLHEWFCEQALNDFDARGEILERIITANDRAAQLGELLADATPRSASNRASLLS